MDVHILRNVLVIVCLLLVCVSLSLSQSEYYDVFDDTDDGFTPAPRRRTPRPPRRQEPRRDRDRGNRGSRVRDRVSDRRRQSELLREREKESERRRLEEQRREEQERREEERRREDERQREEMRRREEELRREEERERQERQMEERRIESARQGSRSVHGSVDRNSDSRDRDSDSRDRNSDSRDTGRDRSGRFQTYQTTTTTSRDSTTTATTTQEPGRSRGRTDSCGCPANIEYSINNLNEYVSTTTKDNKNTQERIGDVEAQIRALEAMVEQFGVESAKWQASMRFPGLTVLNAPHSIGLTDEGVQSDETFKDCQEVLDRGNSQRGVYNLNPEGSAYTTLAFCQDGWTLFQRRFDGSTNFFRIYDEYVEGFGNFSGEFWLGLEMMHQLTNQDTYDLRIDLESHSGKFYYAVYSDFAVKGEDDDYSMNYHNMTSGSGRDGLRRNRGQRFTTWDRDRDNWRSNNCAKHYKSGFWLDRCGSDLNRNPTKGIYGGTKWGGRYVKSSLMRVKPARSMRRKDYKATP